MQDRKHFTRERHIDVATALSEADTRFNEILDDFIDTYGYGLVAESVQRAVFHLNVARSFLDEMAVEEFPDDDEIRRAYCRRLTTPPPDDRA